MAQAIGPLTRWIPISQVIELCSLDFLFPFLYEIMFQHLHRPYHGRMQRNPSFNLLSKYNISNQNCVVDSFPEDTYHNAPDTFRLGGVHPPFFHMFDFNSIADPKIRFKHSWFRLDRLLNGLLRKLVQQDIGSFAG